jgi:hypothetical protein
MGTRTDDAENLVDNTIQVFKRDPDTEPLSTVLKSKRRHLVQQVTEILARQGIKPSAKADAVRGFLFRSAMEGVKIELQREHFVLFKQTDTVQEILEDSFQLELDVEAGRILFPHNQEATDIIVACLFPKDRNLRDRKDVLTFARMFLGRGENRQIQEDKAARYKTMVWFVYLLIDLVRIDKHNVCREGGVHLRSRFFLLLKKSADGEIYCEEREPISYDFEGGRWSRSLFGYLQGQERKPFLVDLLSQFNFENRLDHANRVLLAEHRRCMYRETLVRFC